MKRINGTITLSFVEEDNKQRVIFRVIPLCTREGVVFEDTSETFPDQGSLRVVPDKREQSTFKERMREMGNLCVIELTSSDGKELAKVRQNRNYAPDQGECNQYAIYSDVIHEFACDSVFEVIEWKEQEHLPATALTRTVLFLYNKALYGPVSCEEIEKADITELKPFGNDQFLLHTITLPDHSVHTVYWNPESTLTWRQRRSSLRRKSEKAHQHALEAEASDEAVEEAAAAEVRAETSEPRIANDEAAQPDISLPIGTRLDILDNNITFDQQISLLNQPLAESANRLDFDAAAARQASNPSASRFAGTPFVRDSVLMPRSVSRAEPLHYVVGQQMRQGREGRQGAEAFGEGARNLDNPIENLLLAVDASWQSAEIREQAIDILLENRGFVESILCALRARGQDTHAVAAAYAQLEDIEAERLSVLMQLDQAKESRKLYQEQAIAEASQKKQAEIAKLTREIESLTNEKDALLETIQELEKTPEQAVQALAQRLTFWGGVAEDGHRLLTPVIGCHHKGQDMLDTVRSRLCASGFPMNTDDVMFLLIAFSLYPSLCFQGESIATAHQFAAVFLEALGLQGVSACVKSQAKVQVASLLPENAFRTPTITIQQLGTDMISAFGHKTFYLAEGIQGAGRLAEFPCPHPVIRVPSMDGSLHEQRGDTALPLKSAALSSFQELTHDLYPLLDEGEKWFEELQTRFETNGIPLPEALLHSMRRFVSISSRKVRGGFLAAADAAICLWIVPELTSRAVDTKPVQSVLSALPRALEALGFTS